jgi:hypothetical protein
MFHVLYEHTTREPVDSGTYSWAALKAFHHTLCQVRIAIEAPHSDPRSHHLALSFTIDWWWWWLVRGSPCRVRFE